MDKSVKINQSSMKTNAALEMSYTDSYNRIAA